MNIRKVIVPTDFSPYSESVVGYIKNIFGETLPEIEFLHVMMKEPPILAIRSLDLTKEKMLAEIRTDVETSMQEFVRKAAEKLNTKPQFSIRQGLEYQEIIEFAVEKNADMIIIATHGRTGLLHTLIGSVVEKVIRYSKIPVLVVHPEYKANN